MTPEEIKKAKKREYNKKYNARLKKAPKMNGQASSPFRFCPCCGTNIEELVLAHALLTAKRK